MKIGEALPGTCFCSYATGIDHYRRPVPAANTPDECYSKGQHTYYELSQAGHISTADFFIYMLCT
ncbi:hypothetical protein, partial [Leclercia adecarboxylata]|uniref:hypothetical protein n=1 Tax=Leclercia adecarboxylata TaxID=83655 RepID=UPI00294A437D